MLSNNARYLFAGPNASGVGFHAHAESAALLLRGLKVWLLYDDDKVQAKSVSRFVCVPAVVIWLRGEQRSEVALCTAA